MKKLIVANWKANPSSLGQAISLAKKIGSAARASKNAEVVIAPPFPYLETVRRSVGKIKLAAQNAFCENAGPYTGEVSASMLKSLGVEYVIIGHSERRKLLHETDEIINKKVRICLKTGLKVILCVGENERAGIGKAKKYVQTQLKKDLKGVKNTKSLVIAYEPVWAISGNGGKADSPETAREIIRYIKRIRESRILYGGSVNSRNAKGFLCYNEINGALVGGASLNIEEFKKIIKSIH